MQTEKSLNIQDCFTRFQQGLEDFIVSRTNDRELAKDLTQEVFIRITRYCNKGGEAQHPKAFLYKTALNVIADHYRKEKKGVPLTGMESSDEALAKDHSGRDFDPKFLECIHILVDELDEPYSEAVRMADLQSFSQKEIAEKKGISHSGVKSRVQRGRKMLKERLESIAQKGPESCPCQQKYPDYPENGDFC